MEGHEGLEAVVRGQFPIRNGTIFHARERKLKPIAQRLELHDDDVCPFEGLA